VGLMENFQFISPNFVFIKHSNYQVLFKINLFCLKPSNGTYFIELQLLEFLCFFTCERGHVFAMFLKRLYFVKTLKHNLNY